MSRFWCLLWSCSTGNILMSCHFVHACVLILALCRCKDKPSLSVYFKMHAKVPECNMFFLGFSVLTFNIVLSKSSIYYCLKTVFAFTHIPLSRLTWTAWCLCGYIMNCLCEEMTGILVVIVSASCSLADREYHCTHDMVTKVLALNSLLKTAFLPNFLQVSTWIRSNLWALI